MVMETEEKLRMVEQTQKSSMPSIIDVTLTTANKEYKHQLPLGCKRFIIQMRDSTNFLLAVEYDVVSASTPKYPRYFTVKSGTVLDINGLDIAEDVWLYFMCTGSGKIVEIIQWT